MEYRYRTVQYTPRIPVYVDVYKDTVNYKPKTVKSLWEWFEKDWDEWIDIAACWWASRRKIVTMSKSLASTSISYETYTIDLEKLVNSILKYNHEYQCVTGKPITHILVGHTEYYKLQYDNEIRAFMFPTHLTNEAGRFIFANCQIILIPHMEGMLFLPEMPEPINFNYGARGVY
jgi:hypothetical protein